MSWSATFLADFTQWDQQLRQAETKLGAFEQSTQKTKNSLQKMVSEFDGTKVIQQAGTMAEAVTRAGGAAKLTDAELKKVNATLQEAIQKYQRMGQEAPSSLSSMADAVRKQLGPLEEAGKKTTMWGSALGSVKTVAAGFVAGFTLDRVVGGLANAVSSTIAWGGAMTDMSAKTGVSTTALQKWEYAAKQSGNTLDQVVSASLQLSKRIEEGDKAVSEALKGLGLNMASLQTLQPEQQFDAVATALAKTSDQGHRASAAMALFGKAGADLLPTLTSDMKALGDEAERLGVIVDEQTLVAMDELGDAWQKANDAGRGLLAEVLSPMVPELNRLAGAAANAAKAFREDWVDAIWKVNEAARGGLFFGALFGQQFGGPGKPTYTPSSSSTLPTGVLVPGVTTSETVGPYFRPGDDVVAGVRMVDIDPKLKAAAVAATRHATEMAEFAREAALRWRNIVQTSDWLMARMGQVAMGFTAPGLTPTTPLGGQDNPWGGISNTSILGGGGGNYSYLMRPGFNFANVGLAGLGAAMPFLAQLTAGGSRGGQVGGSIGGTVGGILGSKDLFGGLSGLGGFAGVLGAAAPFLGPALGLVGSLIGKLFGPSRGAILGKEADQRIGQTQAGLLQQYGSVENIRALGPYGSALADAWGSKNVQGEQWFNSLTKGLQEQLSLQEQIKSIEEQRAAINESLKTTWDQVVDIATRYGISLEGLGTQVAQLGATTTWTGMLEDIEKLVRAGADMGGILVGMQDEISALVQESIRLGTEIPENMRPYIDELVRSGKLVDANGEALVDLAGVKWGPAVQTQADIAAQAMEKLDTAMEKLVARLEEIVDLLANGLPDAAAQGARGAGGAVSGIEPGIRIGVEESFAGGSHGVQDFGAGTLAMLHGREIVQTEAQYRASQGGTITASQVVLDKRVLGEIIFELLPAVAARRGLVPGMAY